MEKQIYSAMKGVIIGDLRQAYIHMDAVDFKNLLSEIKEIIEYYDKEMR